MRPVGMTVRCIWGPHTIKSIERLEDLVEDHKEAVRAYVERLQATSSQGFRAFINNVPNIFDLIA